MEIPTAAGGYITIYFFMQQPLDIFNVQSYNVNINSHESRFIS